MIRVRMPKAIEECEVTQFRTPLGDVTVTGWLSDDGEVLTRLTFSNSFGMTSNHYISVNDVERLARALQRWLSEIREHARSR